MLTLSVSFRSGKWQIIMSPKPYQQILISITNIIKVTAKNCSISTDRIIFSQYPSDSIAFSAFPKGKGRVKQTVVLILNWRLAPSSFHTNICKELVRKQLTFCSNSVNIFLQGYSIMLKLWNFRGCYLKKSLERDITIQLLKSVYFPNSRLESVGASIPQAPPNLHRPTTASLFEAFYSPGQSQSYSF